MGALTLLCAPLIVHAGSPEGPLPAPPPGDGPALRLAGGWQAGLVPPFRAAAQDRWSGTVDLAWRPVGVATLGLRATAAGARDPLGASVAGPDSLLLWTALHPLAPDLLPVDVALAWGARVPWSFDAGALGTDETDSLLLAAVDRRQGPLTVGAVLGLDIRGNPLRFADQDDVPLAWLRADLAPPRWALHPHARLGGDLPTPRNPARLEALAGVETRCPLLLGAEAGLPLSVAAADWTARAWVGAAAGCRHGARD